MFERIYFTYILASRSRTLYVGVTSNIERRIAEHRKESSECFTGKYRCNRLVWIERYDSPGAAIAREKQLKGWRRSKKLSLIESANPTWIDLSENWGKPFAKPHDLMTPKT